MSNHTERLELVSKLGLKFNGAEYILGDINLHWSEIMCDSDEEFDNKIKNITAEIKRRESLNASRSTKITLMDRIKKLFNKLVA